MTKTSSAGKRVPGTRVPTSEQCSAILQEREEKRGTGGKRKKDGKRAKKIEREAAKKKAKERKAKQEVAKKKAEEKARKAAERNKI